jgi:hypothetical protein
LKEKKDKLFLSFEKIARNTGEDEYDLIYFLAKENGIYISDKINPSLSHNQITVWALKPYTDEEYKNLKFYFSSRFPYLLLDKIIHRIEKDGLLYIEYPEFVAYWKVYGDIFEVLFEEHGIESNQFNEIEWLEIFDTEEWRSCVIQTARELVAFKIIHNKT